MSSNRNTKHTSPGSASGRAITLSMYSSSSGPGGRADRGSESKLTINCIGEGRSFIVEANFELIEHLFCGLEDLYWRSPLRLSAAHIIGLLLTNRNSLQHSYCGHVLSTKELEDAVDAAFSAPVIEVFISLCCFLLPTLRCFKCDARGRRVAMTAGPHTLPPFNKEKDKMQKKSNEDRVNSSLTAFRLSMTEFEATGAHSSQKFGAVVKHWMGMKKDFNIQSENNQKAQDIDSMLLSRYEDIIHGRSQRYGNQNQLMLAMLTQCLADQVETLATSSPPSTPHLPVLSNMPMHFQKLIQADLWPLLVLAEALGVHRMFSALSYVMLQQLRLHDRPTRHNSDADLSSEERRLMDDLASVENDLDASFTMDLRHEDTSHATEAAADISIEHSRRQAPPSPHSHPAATLRESKEDLTIVRGGVKYRDGIVGETESLESPSHSSMFDDDEDNTGISNSSGSSHAARTSSHQEATRITTKPPPSKEVERSHNLTPVSEIPEHAASGHATQGTTSSRIGLTVAASGSSMDDEAKAEGGNTDKEIIAYQARRKALVRLRERARRESVEKNSPKGPSVKEKLAIVRSAAVVARARSASPKHRRIRLPTSVPHNGTTAVGTPPPRQSITGSYSSPSPSSTTPKRVVSGLSSPVQLWGTPRPSNSRQTSPFTPTSVMDIDEVVSNATKKAKERIHIHRRELDAQLDREEKERDEIEEEKWRERNRRLELFKNRQQGGAGSHALVSELDNDPRGSFNPTIQRSVRFSDQCNAVETEDEERGRDKVIAAMESAAPVGRKGEKLKKYRRFTKLLYGNSVADECTEQRYEGYEHNKSQAISNGKKQVQSCKGSENPVRDVVDVAEELESMITSALSPVRHGSADDTAWVDRDITGYLSVKPSSAGDRGFNAPPLSASTSRKNSQLSNVFSPDATYRDKSEDYNEELEYYSGYDDAAENSGMQPTITVHRAMKLPEMLSGCNPYVILDWGYMGEAVTPSVSNSTNPSFKELRRFKRCKAEEITTNSQFFYPALDVLVFHKNVSVSDEFIGKGHISEVNISSGVHIVHLFDGDGDQAGQVVLELTIPQQTYY